MILVKMKTGIKYYIGFIVFSGFLLQVVTRKCGQPKVCLCDIYNKIIVYHGKYIYHFPQFTYFWLHKTETITISNTQISEINIRSFLSLKKVNILNNDNLCRIVPDVKSVVFENNNFDSFGIMLKNALDIPNNLQ